MMEKYTILQVIGGLNRGGAETMLMNLYRKLDRKKFKFVFLTYNHLLLHSSAMCLATCMPLADAWESE